MACCKRGTYNVLMHGLAFMAMFTAFQTTVLKDQHLGASLGFQSLAIIYVVFSLFNFISPSVVALIGPRPSMIFGSVMYALFIAAFLKPMRWSILAASVLVGMGAAVIWTAQGNFLTLNTTKENRGQMSGIFWALLQCSLLIGNLIGYFLLSGDTIGADEAHRFYQILFGAACGGVVLFFFLRRSRPERTEDYTSVEDVEPRSIREEISNTIALLLTKDMLLLSISIMYSGLVLTFWSAKYPTMVGDAFQPKDIGLSGITVGVAEILGGLTMGRLADAYGRPWVMMVTLFVHAAGGFLVFLNLISNYLTPSLELALLGSFLLGFGDSSVNTALYSELGQRYTDESASAFAVFKFFQSAMAGIAQAYAGELSASYQLLILAIFLLSGSYTFIMVSKKPIETSTDFRYTKILND